MRTGLGRYLLYPLNNCRRIFQCQADRSKIYFVYIGGYGMRLASRPASTAILESSSLRNDEINKGRHHWAKEEDKHLLQLVETHGPLWTFIAGKLGIEGDPMKARRRWEVLQPKTKGFWTKAEDQDLANVVQRYVDLGYTLSEKYVWANIAQQLKTNRSPRQCHTRWKTTLLPLQGLALPFTRFKHVRGWKWSHDETERLKTAVNVATQLLDPPADIDRAQKSEPWLLIKDDKAKSLKPQFWNNAASFVGTRTASQCRCKWRNMILVSRKTQQPVTIEEAQRLARLVRKYGRRWSYIHRTHFPDRNPDELTYMFKQWERLGKRYNVDLLDVDPFSMISDFDGERAMRPTGPDGNYHPNGPLSQVFKSGHASFLTPYTLALSNIYMRKGSVKIIRALSLAGDSDSMSPLPAKSIDKLIAAIGRHQNDWISISKEVGTSIKQCRQYALILASSITSIRNIISDPDMDSLAQERGWKDMQQKQKQKKKQVE